MLGSDSANAARPGFQQNRPTFKFSIQQRGKTLRRRSSRQTADHSNRASLMHAKGRDVFQVQQSSQPGVVSYLRMRVQRKMCSVKISIKVQLKSQ